jgi:non-ribosomal peptide synthetase component F
LDTPDVFETYAADIPSITIGPDDVAYVAFTSGSSEQPKGVLGRRGPLSHFLPWQAQTFGLSTSDRFSMLSGLSHDPLQRNIFTALWVGGSIAIPCWQLACW